MTHKIAIQALEVCYFEALSYRSPRYGARPSYVNTQMNFKRLGKINRYVVIKGHNLDKRYIKILLVGT